MARKKNTILIADDSSLIRKILSSALDRDYDILEASNGLAAVAVLEQRGYDVAAVILDLVMPKMDGFGVLRFLRYRGLLERIPVLVVTAGDQEAPITAAYDLGVAEVIQKPFNQNIIKKRLRNIIDLYSQKNQLMRTVRLQTQSLEIQAQKLREVNDQVVDVLSTVIEYRSAESGQHTRRLRGFTKLLLTSLPMDIYGISPAEIDLISRASAMHDVGKIAIPDSVLLKPGPLTPEEFAVMQTHTVKGCEILERLHAIDDEKYLNYCREICRWHHERWDGGGYPDGLRGDEIPISAQVVALADAFDALTHKRVYKDAYPVDVSAKMILEGECGAFSPLLLDGFRRSLPLFEQLSIVYCDHPG